MKHIGIDLHKRIIVICVMNDKREIMERKRFSNEETDEMKAYFGSQGKFRAVFEATGSYEWFYRLLEPLAEEVVLAHPKKLRVIAESTQKSDKVDAYVLALFLSLDMIPCAHRPGPYVQGYRRLFRLRHKIQGRITSVKNRIRFILASYNADRKNLFTQKGRRYRNQLKVSEADRFTLTRYEQELELFQAQLKETEKKLRTYTAQAPHRIAESRVLLKTIPGVGDIIADGVMSELGDVDRFSSQKKVSSYAGLVPGYRKSADREIPLGITKQGSKILRWILIEASWMIIRYSAKWKRIYERLLKQTRKVQKAIAAVARRVLCMMVSMLQNGSAYNPSL